MKAIGLHNELLVEVTLPMPEPGDHDLLVQVKSISVNPVDYKIFNRRKEESEEPVILGWDVAGIVKSVGCGTSLFKEGDEVYYAGDISRPGCNSEFHLVDERVVGHKPKTLSFNEAAAMPLTSITAWEALFDRLLVEKSPGKNKGKSILIIGGAGGVGSIAIQLAKKVAGLRVIATASRENTLDWCKKMGADAVINHHNSFKTEFEAQELPEVDYILCFNSMEKHMQNMADVIKAQGKICTIVETPNNEPVNINLFQAKSVGIIWELMFTRTLFQTEDMQEQHKLLNDVATLLDDGTIKPTMTKTYHEFTVETLKAAHQALEAGDMIGKLVIGGVS